MAGAPPVLRVSKSRFARMRKRGPLTLLLFDGLDRSMAEWSHVGREPGDGEVWRLIFASGGHQNQLVFGPDKNGSWNVITVRPLRPAQYQKLKNAWWMRSKEEN